MLRHVRRLLQSEAPWIFLPLTLLVAVVLHSEAPSSASSSPPLDELACAHALAQFFDHSATEYQSPVHAYAVLTRELAAGNQLPEGFAWRDATAEFLAATKQLHLLETARRSFVVGYRQAASLPVPSPRP